MTVTRSQLFQTVRWLLVSISVALGLWMTSSGVRSVFKTSIGWTTPLLGILFIAFVAPLGMIAYFGIKGEYRNFFTTVIFTFCLLIFIFTASALSHIHFTDLIEGWLQPGLVFALIGLLLSVLQLAAPFIPAVYIYRTFMKLLSTFEFSAANDKS